MKLQFIAGLVGDELPDKYAKEAFSVNIVQINVELSKPEAKGISKSLIERKWGEERSKETKGRNYYNIKPTVGSEALSRLRLSHRLKQYLFIYLKKENKAH